MPIDEPFNDPKSEISNQFLYPSPFSNNSFGFHYCRSSPQISIPYIHALKAKKKKTDARYWHLPIDSRLSIIGIAWYLLIGQCLESWKVTSVLTFFHSSITAPILRGFSLLHVEFPFRRWLTKLGFLLQTTDFKNFISNFYEDQFWFLTLLYVQCLVSMYQL